MRLRRALRRISTSPMDLNRIGRATSTFFVHTAAADGGHVRAAVRPASSTGCPHRAPGDPHKLSPGYPQAWTTKLPKPVDRRSAAAVLGFRREAGRSAGRRRGRQALGTGHQIHIGKEADMAETWSGEFYCVKCKAKREATGEVHVSDKGTRMAKGICPVCWYQAEPDSRQGLIHHDVWTVGSPSRSSTRHVGTSGTPSTGLGWLRAEVTQHVRGEHRRCRALPGADRVAPVRAGQRLGRPTSRTPPLTTSSIALVGRVLGLAPGLHRGPRDETKPATPSCSATSSACTEAV